MPEEYCDCCDRQLETFGKWKDIVDSVDCQCDCHHELPCDCGDCDCGYCSGCNSCDRCETPGDACIRGIYGHEDKLKHEIDADAIIDGQPVEHPTLSISGPAQVVAYSNLIGETRNFIPPKLEDMEKTDE